MAGSGPNVGGGFRGSSSAFAEHAEVLDVSAKRNRARWLAARREGIGASDVAAIMGVDDWRGPLAVYESKVGPGDERSANEAATWGLIFEEPILLEYARRVGRGLRVGGELLRSRDDPTFLATLDGEQGERGRPPWANGPGVAECKTTAHASGWRDELPVWVQVQQQWQMRVTRAEWSTCVWLPFPERVLGWVDVQPHAAFSELMAAEAREFWRRVELRDPPPPNAMDSARAALERLLPDISETAVRLTGKGGLDPIRLADEIEAIRAEAKALEWRRKLIQNLMLAAMGPHKWALLDDGRYWSQSQIAARIDKCPHCDGVVREVDEHRRITLCKPSRRVMPPDSGTVTIQAPADDDLVRLLERSVEALTDGKAGGESEGEP